MNAGRTDIVLSLGTLPEQAATALLDAGMSIRSCQDAYDVAAALAEGKDSVRALHVASEALSSRVLALMRLLRDRRRGVALWVGAGKSQTSMMTALNALGASMAEEVFAGLLEYGIRTTASDTPPVPQRSNPDPSPSINHSPPPATHPAPSLRRNSDEAIVVRTPVKAPADNVASDNPVVSSKSIERDSASRYDALTGQPLLTDDELRALLEPSDDSPSA